MFDEVETQAADRSSFFNWSSKAGRCSFNRKTNFAEGERILEVNDHKLFGPPARIKCMGGVKDG